MEEVVRKVLQVLWRDYREVPMREKVHEVVGELGLEIENLDSFTQEVVEEATKRSLRALRGVWASGGIPPDSPEAQEAEKEATGGKKVRVWYPVFWQGPPTRFGVQVLERPNTSPKTTFIVPPKPPEWGMGSAGFDEKAIKFDIDVHFGLVEAEVKPLNLSGRFNGGLTLKEELVYLEAFRFKELEVISKGVKYLIPFFTRTHRAGFFQPRGYGFGSILRGRHNLSCGSKAGQELDWHRQVFFGYYPHPREA
jgi:hypothetical protein